MPIAAIGGSILGGILGSRASGKAADAQSSAANRAAELQYKSSQDALNMQRNMWMQSLLNQQPWWSSGAGALQSLNGLMGIGPAAMPMYQDPSTGQQQQQTTRVGPIFGDWGGYLNVPSGNQSQTNAYSSQLAPSTSAVWGGGPSYPTPGKPGVPTDGPWTGPRPTYPTPGKPGTPMAGGVGSDYSGNAMQPLALGEGQVMPQGYPVSPGNGYGALMQGWDTPFVAPTNVTEQNDPGYQFRLAEGQKALERSAAAKGGLLSGGTAKAMQKYGQDYASNEYGNVYNRALGEYQNAYNIFNQNQTNQFNRLAAMSGLGQTTAGQLANTGSNMANNYGNIMQNMAESMGRQYNNAGNAMASGYINAANAWNNAIGNVANTYMGLWGMNQ